VRIETLRHAFLFVLKHLDKETAVRTVRQTSTDYKGPQIRASMSQQQQYHASISLTVLEDMRMQTVRFTPQRLACRSSLRTS
jgi:hypothetical protein